MAQVILYGTDKRPCLVTDAVNDPSQLCANTVYVRKVRVGANHREQLRSTAPRVSGKGTGCLHEATLSAWLGLRRKRHISMYRLL